MDRYPVVILDRPIRIFDFKPIPLLCLIAAGLIALKLSSYIDPHLLIGNLPLRLITFISAFCMMIPIVKFLELIPPKRWLKIIKHTREPLPLYLPEKELSASLTGSSSACSCLKISNKDVANLDALQRLKIADTIVDFANIQSGSLQIYSPPSRAQSETEQRDFYLIGKENSRLIKLADSIRKYGLSLETVSAVDVRKLLYAQLSPSHKEPDLHTINSITSGGDLLSLCINGFEHHHSYLLIDGKYVSTIHLYSLPLEVNFGLIDKLFNCDVDLAFSMYLRPCNMPALQEQARSRLYFEQSTAGIFDTNKTPASHLEQIRAFCESKIVATGISISATIYADSLNELDCQIMKAKKAVLQMGAGSTRQYDEELEGMISGLPICEDMVAFSHTITSQAAAKFIPFL
jgi:hypothetical protein